MTGTRTAGTEVHTCNRCRIDAAEKRIEFAGVIWCLSCYGRFAAMLMR